jgi:hypothetical protein
VITAIGVPVGIAFTGLLCCVVGFLAARGDEREDVGPEPERKPDMQAYAWPRKRFW